MGCGSSREANEADHDSAVSFPPYFLSSALLCFALLCFAISSMTMMTDQQNSTHALAPHSPPSRARWVQERPPPQPRGQHRPEQQLLRLQRYVFLIFLELDSYIFPLVFWSKKKEKN
jgi:hypothetical protein